MKRSKHNLSYTHLLSCNMGDLIPIGLWEMLPGDSLQLSTSALVRCSPLVAPVMHPVSVRIHHWFVPHRLVWNTWEDFITGGEDGMAAPAFPTMTSATGIQVGTLGDHLGLPLGVPNMTFSALPVRAYQLIWNEWYRDQDLQAEAVVARTNGNDTTTATGIKTVGWEKDYFTSSRPWEQKGPTVTIPVLGQAPVKGIGAVGTLPTMMTPGATARETSGDRAYAFGALGGSSGGAGIGFETDTGTGGTARPKIYADLSTATGLTVNQLRQSLAIQRFEEARARYGSRYTEYLRALGVRSSDARLQRPEYLGGGKQTIQFSEVLQTGGNTSDDPIGDMKGHGITALRSNRFRCFFEEHGYVMSLMSVRPKTIYTQGMARHWNKRTKFDFWQKELQHIGQQPVLNKEVYAGHTTPDDTFGYQDRYDEYRRKESMVSGEFRTSMLEHWHMARTFASPPALNASFVSCVPTDRVFAVPSQDTLFVHCRHSANARRLLSAEGTSFTF